MTAPASALHAAKAMHFRDARPPQAIQFQLERELIALFQPVQPAEKYGCSALLKDGVIPLRLDLRFEAALTFTNCYSLVLLVDTSALPPEKHESARKSADGWFDFWTRELNRAPAPEPGQGSAGLYEQLAAKWLVAEAHLTSIREIQQAILAAMRSGAVYLSSDKEGTSELKYANGRYGWAHNGDMSYGQAFPDEAAFLAFLRQFHDSRLSLAIWPDKVSEHDAWKLILRLLEPRRSFVPPLVALPRWQAVLRGWLGWA